MPLNRPKRVSWLVVVAMAAAAVNAAAQTEEPETAEDDDETLDEVVVIYRKSGDPTDVETPHESELRKRVLDEYNRQALQEERNRWREADPDVNDPSRIKWGYDPQDELRMRRDTGLTDLPFERTKPATIFRVEF